MKNKYFCWLFLLFALISAGANAQVKVVVYSTRWIIR